MEQSNRGETAALLEHTQRFVQTIAPTVASSEWEERSAREIADMPTERRASFIATIENGIRDGLIGTGAFSGVDYAASWRRVFARVQEMLDHDQEQQPTM